MWLRHMMQLLQMPVRCSTCIVRATLHESRRPPLCDTCAVRAAQIQHLVEEEEAAYSAQSAVMPLRELASARGAYAGSEAKHGAQLPGGATELMGGHTAPPPAAAEFAPAAEARARSGREAQQAELVAKTGDTLYKSAGELPRPPTCDTAGFLVVT